MNQIEELLNNKKKEIKNNYIKIISNLIKSGVNKEEVLSLVENYENKKNLYKEHKVYFKEYFNKKELSHSDFEKLRDRLYEVDIKQKHNQIIKRLKSKQNLINKETKLITLEMAKEGISIEFISEAIANKISSIPNSNKLNELLQEQLDFVRGDWNSKVIKEKASKYNTTIISEEGNKLVLAINDFEASSKIGTNNWCLVRNKSDYDYYVSPDEGYKRVCFVFDFNKTPENKNSLNAVLLKVDGSIYETYNKSDDLISNKNVINIDFPEMNKNKIKEKIINNIKNKEDLLKELIVYKLYDEAKEITTIENYKKKLSELYSYNVGKITLTGGMVDFFEELEGNDSKIDGNILSEWIRESIYLGDYAAVEKILEKDFFRKGIKENIKHYEDDFVTIYNELFQDDNIKKYKFALKLEAEINKITEGESRSLSMFEVLKYSENALTFISNEMPFIKEEEMKDEKIRKNILDLVEFKYSEENIENYFNFIDLNKNNINEIKIEMIEELLHDVKIKTLFKGRSNVMPKLKIPISNIIGKEKFNKFATLDKDFLNVLSMLNTKEINNKAMFISEILNFNIEKLNKEDTNKFLSVFIGKKNQKETFVNSSNIEQIYFKRMLLKYKDNLDKEALNSLLIKIDKPDLLNDDNDSNKKRKKLKY